MAKPASASRIRRLLRSVRAPGNEGGPRTALLSLSGFTTNAMLLYVGDHPTAGNALLRSAAVLICALSTGCTLTNLDGLSSERGNGGGGAGGNGGESQGGGGTTVASPCEDGAVVGACGDGEKCTLAVPGQGATAGLVCGPAGSVQAWTPCSADADCADGLWCEEGSGVCKPWCVDAGICPDGASCVSARRLDGTAITDWTVCTAHCLLDNPAARCGSGATCVLVQLEGGTVSEGDCAASGGKGAGCLCELSADCAPGLRCDPTDLRCHAWCDAGGLCAGGGNCGSTIATYDGTAYGQCPVTMCFNN